jgi:hypothetical protein
MSETESSRSSGDMTTHVPEPEDMMDAQTPAERSYSEILGDWIVQYAKNVGDMGDRVAEVLGRDPNDHHYAGSKLSHALIEGTKALALVGWKEDEVLELIQAAYENGVRYKQDLSREFERSRS